MITADLVVDVADSRRVGRPLHVTATVFMPPPEMLADNPIVVFAVPGGGYSRGYYDMHFPGHEGYSQAEHLVQRGFVLVAIDHLGVGESTPEVAESLTIEDIAAGNDLAVRAITDRLRRGTAVPGYPAVDVGARIGIGQSMGGGVTVIMAVRHHTYDAVAVLGYSAIHTVLPLRQDDVTRHTADQFKNFSRATAPDELSPAELSQRLPALFYPFFWDDVPADIVEADTRGGYPIRTTVPAFGSQIPNCVGAMLSPGYISSEAAVLDIPVFIGLGERDTAPDPRQEPAAYPNSTDITLFICEGMAHMHNFATTRRKFWDRLAQWCAGVVDTHPGR